MKKNTRQCLRGRRPLFPAPAIVHALLTLALTFSLGPRAALAEEPLDRQITIDISANTPLEDALIEWGLKARLTVMINTQVVSQYVTKHVSGTLTARRALILLLQDSHLSYTRDEERIHIVPIAALTRAISTPSSDAQPMGTLHSTGPTQDTHLDPRR